MLHAGPYSETARQLVHVGFGGAALLLRCLDWWQAVVLAAAAILFKVTLLHGLAGERLAVLAWWCGAVVLPRPALWFSFTAPFAAALVATLVETARIRLDDNLSVPVTAAAVLWILSLPPLSLAGPAT